MATTTIAIHEPFTLPSPIPEHKTPDHDKIHNHLTLLTPIQRSTAFANNFTRDERPVHTIGTMIGHPEILQTYPQFEVEVVDSYLANTLFTAEVKVPYDMATYDFSEENFGDCGRILEPDVPCMRYIDLAAPFTTQVNRVRFDVRTPFSHVLCHMFLTMLPGQRGEVEDGEVVGEEKEESRREKIVATVSPVSYGHEVLFGYLESVCQTLQAQKFEGHPTGFSYQNLEVIASYFVPSKLLG